MATLPFKSAHKEQPYVIHLLWAKGLSAKCRSVWYASSSILQDQQYMFGVKSLLMVEKVLFMMNLDDTLKNETLMFDV